MKIKTNEINRRYVEPNIKIEIREGETALKINGAPIVYNRETVLYENDYVKMTEIIEQGAAREALLKAEQVLLWNHDTAKPMAARKNNTLLARDESDGVHIEADVSGTVWGREGYEAIKSGLVDKMSFGFYLKSDGYTEERTVENGKRIVKTIIKKFDSIVDFSPVTYPAYKDTSLSARDAESIVKEIEAEEKRQAEKYQIFSKTVAQINKEIEEGDLRIKNIGL